MSKSVVDKGPWHHGVTQDGKRHFVQSEDFRHDTRLYIDGDFAGTNDKERYAKGIATQLNAAPVAAQAPVFSVGVRGVGIIDDNPSALAVYFNAAPNDDDIRALHEIVSAAQVATTSPALAQGEARMNKGITRGKDGNLAQKDGPEVAAQSSAPAIPPEKPLPDLMMASYHEAIGWNECRKAMIAAQAQQPVSGDEPVIGWYDPVGGTYYPSRDSIKKYLPEGRSVRPLGYVDTQPVSGADLSKALRHLIRGYVNLMENGRDRILEAGGRCDPLDVMEASDPWLKSARAALAQQDTDKVDAERYQAWRDALITGKTAEDDFIRLVADSLPTSVGVSRRPTAAEWDAAIDAARKEQA